jgi:subtilisin family serine protease
MSQSNGGPIRLRKRAPSYVANEVIVTTVKKARNDDVPHFLNVATEAVAGVSSYGEPGIDGVIQRLGYNTRSIARVFVPRSAAATPAQTELEGLSLARAAIPADYADDEDAAGLSRTYKVTFENEVNVYRLCDELTKSRAVQGARPNYIREAVARPSDFFYGYQWGPKVIDCEAGWEIETGHPDVVIAIVDSGVDLHHEDLESKLLPGQDFVDVQGSLGWRYTPLGDYRNRDDEPQDEDGHGTHCAGIAGAASGNGEGVAGVCWGGSILPVRVMFRVYDYVSGRETSVGTDADIDAGIKFAADAGAHVMNLSLGGPEPSHETVLEYAYDKNVCVFAATGNEDSSDPSYPASNPKTLAVGAVDSNLNRASFSNYGSAYNQFVVAPGVKIASTYKDNAYVYLDGTSMATPFVTGLGALMVSLALRSSKQLMVDDVYRIIRETAKPRGSGRGDVFFGEGLVNVAAALEATKQKLEC